jgi:hypothetical protein
MTPQNDVIVRAKRMIRNLFGYNFINMKIRQIPLQYGFVTESRVSEDGFFHSFCCSVIFVIIGGRFMARPCAFNKEELLAYLDGLASIGEAVPSCAALRKKFGGGSYTTLTKIVAEWKQKSNPNTSEIEVLPTVRKDLKEKELARQADEAVWTFQAAITEALKNYRKDEEARFKKL